MNLFLAALEKDIHEDILDATETYESPSIILLNVIRHGSKAD